MFCVKVNASVANLLLKRRTDSPIRLETSRFLSLSTAHIRTQTDRCSIAPACDHPMLTLSRPRARQLHSPLFRVRAILTTTKNYYGCTLYPVRVRTNTTCSIASAPRFYSSQVGDLDSVAWFVIGEFRSGFAKDSTISFVLATTCESNQYDLSDPCWRANILHSILSVDRAIATTIV
jgi:hypothetical protein